MTMVAAINDGTHGGDNYGSGCNGGHGGGNNRRDGDRLIEIF